MVDIKQQIFQELTAVEELATSLRSTAVNAGKQTDLEVAILSQQVKNLREKNARAADLVDRSISILKKLK